MPWFRLPQFGCDLDLFCALLWRLRSHEVLRGMVRPASRQTVWVRGAFSKPYFGIAASTTPPRSTSADDPSGFPRDAHELREMSPRPDVRWLPRVDRPDRHRIERQAKRQAARDHLDL